MAKGIRTATIAKFIELATVRSEMGNKAFRKAVTTSIADEFGISIASASSAYNIAFKSIKQTNPELVEGLGRTAKVKAEAAEAPTEVVETPVEVADVVEVVVAAKPKRVRKPAPKKVK
jgi:hypothetical protein